MTRTIILAAGQGKRLMPHTKNSPKCLVSISSKDTILSHQLNNLKKANLKDVVILTGYQHPLIERHVKPFKKSLNIKLEYFPFYDNSGNLMTLWWAKYYFNGEIVIINGDNVFGWKVLNLLKNKSNHDGILLSNKKPTYDDDDMLVTERKGMLTGVSKTLPRKRVSGESIGIMSFSKKGASRLKNTLRDIVINHPHAKDLWYLHAIDTMAQEHKSIKVNYIDNRYWFEVDYPKDLKEVQNFLSNNEKNTSS